MSVHDDRWTSFAASHRKSTAFHRPSWCDLLTDCYGFPSFVVALLDTSGRVCAGVPMMDVRLPGRRRRWVGLPFSDECEPLLGPTGDLATLTRGLAALSARARVSRAEVHGPLAGPLVKDAVVATKQVLDLTPGADALRAGFRAGTRRDARRAATAGLTLRRSTSRRDLTVEYYRLHVATRRRLGVPPQPERYFDLLWQHVLRPGAGFVTLAERDGSAVAGAVFLEGSRTVTYKYGASDERGRACGASHLILADIIARLAAHGWERLDFGSTGLTDVGLQRFKTGWGATTEELRYAQVGERAAPPLPQGLQPRTRELFRRAPKLLTRAVSGALYRYAA